MGKAKVKPADKEALIAEILMGISTGESMRAMCELHGVALTTFFQWVSEPAYVEQYARAREARADLYFEQLDDVSDAASTAETAVEVAGLRLKADNMKWKLARMSPKKYGDKMQTEVTGANGGPLDFSLKVSFVTPATKK